ncbi:hypothetical protein PYW07_012918 [Mythimna separata]|uniref:Uncharacterized protein n=1 Tax=Mythimna separata TaxID=271217 RepID=A0AAD7Y922_MYTSE|nr:hypothetical protein PYW07_012918 [Mythimna separata]
MERMEMCRICLVENVRMNIVDDKDLQKIYETLTDIPFVTEDRRPMLVCFLCFAQLKQCCQLQRKCLEAEELLAQMMNERDPLSNQGPMENVSHIESVTIKQELPDVCEGQDDVVEPKGEHFEYELQLEHLKTSYSDAEDIPAQQSESDTEHDEPSMDIKTKVEEVPSKKRRASDTTRAVAVKKRNLHVRGKKLEDVITVIQKKNEDFDESDSEVSQDTESGTSRLIPSFQKVTVNTTPRVDDSDTLDTSCVNDNENSNDDVTKDKKPFKCDVCQISFIRKNHLTNHIRTHTREKPFVCKECQLCFSQKVHLTNHIRLHTGEKPYKCKDCQLCFSRKDSLTRHIRVHTGEKPYKCPECQLCFSQRDHLTRHIRTHTGEKPYKCEECQLSFSQKATLLKHIATHSGDKPYKCEKCHLCFEWKQQLTRHTRTHTGETP